MPLVRSRVATVSDGCAPCSSQWRARSSSMLIVEGSVCGLYWPIVSIVRPTGTEGIAMGVVEFLTNMGLFKGQSAGFFEALKQLAREADAAKPRG